MENDKKTILIVEDEVAMAEAMSAKIGKAGFTVINAHDGEEGLKMFNEHHPDLVMLDIIMPKLDGISVLKQIRTDNRYGDIPVIMLSNLNDTDNISEVAQYHVFDYLVKTDWRLDDVVALIKERLNITT